MNEYMKTILNRYKMKYKPLLTTTLPPRLYKYIETGVEFRKDVNSYTYKDVEKFELYYEDKTGNEKNNRCNSSDNSHSINSFCCFKGHTILHAGK